MWVRMVRTAWNAWSIEMTGADRRTVRVSAKELTSLILDEERLRAERNDRKTWKSRVTGIEEYNSAHSPPEPSRRSRPHRAQRADEEDAEYRLAIEASKYQEEEDRKRRQNQRQDPDDDDLAKAIKLSKEEEELRRRELEESNAASLFDDDPLPPTQPQYTGFNQGYQQQGAVDWSGNPIDQQNQMNMQPTGYNNNLYGQPTGFQSQPTGFQSQPTGYQNGFSNGLNNQATGFDPYGQQASPFQPQQTGFNPYAQQQQQQQQPSAELQIPVSTNNPWATTNQQSAQPQVPMQTGSNNPFASSFNRPQTSSGVPQSQPTLSALQEQKTMSQFNNSSSFNPPTTFSPPPMPSIPQNVKPISEHEAKLNALLASGDGMDTFGNTGDLRIPAQHTAPGQFLNSAGQGRRLDSQQTGNNPFLHNQFTGMPQTQYNNSGFNGQMMPAATGPASSFGGGGFGQQNNNNPFGQRTQQQQSSSSGGQDLIQF